MALLWGASNAHAATAVPETAPAKIARRVLRVGTTGDYRPYSFTDLASRELIGIDIELARDLARFLGLKLQIVKTTWPTLKQDYESGQFDVALSGITKTAERAQWGVFSQGYSADGKTPIARCDRKKSFDSLEKIDQPAVTVITNPGGTNQKFVTKHFRHAKVTVFADNSLIFDQLIARKADVMVTDSLEVALQTALHRELCSTMPGAKFDPSEQGVLIARDDPELRRKIDIWLNEIKGNGKLAGLMMKYTSP